MSQAQRSPMSPQSLPPFSPTSSAAAPPRPHELRYAESDEDIVEIHRFLLRVATPALRCPVNFLKSLGEIARVTHTAAALMVFVDDRLIGTMGLIRPDWWYGDNSFLTDRWHFVEPEFDGTVASQSLIEEAEQIAAAAEVDFIHQGRMRERRPGVYFMWPRVSRPTDGG